MSGVMAHIRNSLIWAAEREGCEFQAGLKGWSGVVTSATVETLVSLIPRILNSVMVNMGAYQTSLF